MKTTLQRILVIGLSLAVIAAFFSSFRAAADDSDGPEICENAALGGLHKQMEKMGDLFTQLKKDIVDNKTIRPDCSSCEPKLQQGTLTMAEALRDGLKEAKNKAPTKILNPETCTLANAQAEQIFKAYQADMDKMIALVDTLVTAVQSDKVAMSNPGSTGPVQALAVYNQIKALQKKDHSNEQYKDQD